MNILESERYEGYELSIYRGKSFLKKICSRLMLHKDVLRFLRNCMEKSDILWTTSMQSIRELKGEVLKYKHVLQLMELTKYGYMYHTKFRFPIAKYAKNAWRTVVPEINRAYIQKIWWELSQTPHILPNKPYSLDISDIIPELSEAIDKMKAEKKKIILYLGGLHDDRSFEEFAKVISDSDEYRMYIVGKTFGNGERVLNRLINEHRAVYLGSFDPPKHLCVVKYAYIGLLPYMPGNNGELSELNALYCAPNKIWEYAGFGVPMVGSDVLGLKLPFEQWNIGRCCDLNNEASIIKAIEEVDRNHDEMSKNCYKFYDSVDLEKVVSEILEDEN